MSGDALPRDFQGPKSVGTSVPRLNAEAFVTGAAVYAADVIPSDVLHLRVVRSSYARAKIISIFTKDAERIPGFVTFVSASDMWQFTRPTPSRFSKDRFPGPLDVRPLALDEVKYVGEPVIAVLAESPAAARLAAELITIEYEPLAPILNPIAALTAVEYVHPQWKTNVAAHDVIRVGDPESEFFRPDVVTVSGKLTVECSTSAPIEMRSYVAEWDPRAARLKIQGAFQMPHPSRWTIAHALGLKESQVQIVAQNIGGTFGLKMVGHPEEVLVGFLAMKTQRRVAFVEDRDECFLARGREQTHSFQIAATRDGRITAFRDRMVADIGAVGAGGGWQMALVTAAVMPTVYKIENCLIDCSLATTNKSPWQGIRGYGKEIGNLVVERAVELLAAALSMDPNELRRLNLNPSDAFPYRLPSGMIVDSGDYAPALKKLEGMRRGWPAQRAATAHDETAIGHGFAFELTPEGAAFPGAVPSGFETATVKVDPSGEITVLASITSPGGGNETGLAQLVGDVFGAAPDVITVRQGDTEVTPFGGGNSSSRSLMLCGAAAVAAAQDVLSKLARCAANLLQCDPAETVFHDGEVFSIRSPEKRLIFGAVALAVYTHPFSSGDGVELPLQSTKSYKAQNVRHVPDEQGRINAYPSYPYSVHAAAVEVSHDTGVVRVLKYSVVHDCGTVINPALVDGQMRGAVVMGIGAALWERMETDENGRKVNDRLKNYLLPRALDVPAIEIGNQLTPSMFHPLGMKGAGESGVGGAMACVINAVGDAIGAEAASRLDTIPATPLRILRALRGANS
ncbi:carbon-monoxide dehydrogenase large subunit [Phyllobacterium sp. 1468]|uniref:xanthine dehydrogenase family protein molybdopterin-binding subunit n=1 Tax=Phyllobacterium sp. 1468 TaxID=2817759 RepID=UPI002856501F|nr:xanthine dehydrogenase family protein molybdopterin-binding subunit [Phyllobacterium sp. 1468]MDR6632629.1 carbon-monoxide dehydrogenase large subunit [Phyllobacterium sp. 1468]